MISCNDHDYIEIACLYRYPLRLLFKSGESIEGKALDTARNSDREECIKIDVDGEEKLIVLDQLEKMVACVENPHFQEVSFVNK